MKRQNVLMPVMLFILLLMLVAALSLPVALAQEAPPIVTVTPTLAGGAASQPEPTSTPVDGGVAPQPEPTSTPGSDAAAPVEVAPVTGDAAPVLDAVAADITLFADLVYGANVRPESWTLSLTPDNPQYALLLRLNLEILAGQVTGPDARPVRWFGAVPSSRYAIARDIRHDLELLASAVNEPAQARAPGWRGDDPIMQCGRATQALVGVLEAGGVFRLEADPTSPDYCVQAEIQASQFAEQNLLTNTAPAANPAAPAIVAGSESVLTQFAVGFLDRSAAQRVGVLPVGTPFMPVARSYAQFSNMMLIRGDGFELFVDYQQTSVSPDGFTALVNVDDLAINPFCTTDWCGGE